MPDRRQDDRREKGDERIGIVADLIRLRNYFRDHNEPDYADSLNKIVNEVQQRRIHDERRKHDRRDSAPERSPADDADDDDHSDNAWVHDPDMGAKG